jgi:hypothetical protein
MLCSHKRTKFTKEPLVHTCLLFTVFNCDTSVEHIFSAWLRRRDSGAVRLGLDLASVDLRLVAS